MQATFTSSCPNTCSILRLSGTSNGAGGTIPTWTPAYTNVPCRFGPFRVPFLEQLSLDNTKVASKTRWEFAFPIGTDVTVKDRIAVNGGNTYEVASPRTPESYQLYVSFLCELVF